MTRKHTPPAAPPAHRAAIVERKRKPGGDVREYACELVARTPGLAIIAYPITGGTGGFSLPITLPPGSVSYGYFWARRPYSLYRFLGPGGEPLGHRFDAVANVRLGPDAIDYDDLFLDWWALPGGRLVEEDRDEFERARAAGFLGAREAATAEAAARAIFSRYRHIIDEVEALERRLVRVAPRGDSG